MKVEAKIVTFRADHHQDDEVLSQFLEDGWMISSSVKGDDEQVILVFTRFTNNEESAESGESTQGVLPIKWEDEVLSSSGDKNSAGFYNYEIIDTLHHEFSARFETEGTSRSLGEFEKIGQAKQACQEHKEARWKKLILEFTGKAI